MRDAIAKCESLQELEGIVWALKALSRDFTPEEFNLYAMRKVHLEKLR